MALPGRSPRRLLSRLSGAQMLTASSILIALLLTIVVIPALAGFDVPPPQGPRATSVEGRIAAVLERTSIDSGRGIGERERLAVDADGTTVTVERTRDPHDIGRLDVEVGDRVLLARTPGPDGPSYYIVDRIRTDALWVLGGAFVLLALVVGRHHGATAILGLPQACSSSCASSSPAPCRATTRGWLPSPARS